MNRMHEKNRRHDKYYYLLVEDLERTRQDLTIAYDNLSNAVEPDLIDCYIYELNAVQMRYKFLLGRIKQIEDSYAKNPLELSGS